MSLSGVFLSFVDIWGGCDDSASGKGGDLRVQSFLVKRGTRSLMVKWIRTPTVCIERTYRYATHRYCSPCLSDTKGIVGICCRVQVLLHPNTLSAMWQEMSTLILCSDNVLRFWWLFEFSSQMEHPMILLRVAQCLFWKLALFRGVKHSCLCFSPFIEKPYDGKPHV